MERIIKPNFPVKYFGEVNAFPYAGGMAVPNLLARIPHYTMEKNPTKRLLMEMQYNELQKKEYEEAVEFYKGINVGDVYHAGRPETTTIRISKISLRNDALFINLCATQLHKQYAKERGLKPVKSVRWQFEIFQSLIKSKTLFKL